jgi:hypothetical protein
MYLFIVMTCSYPVFRLNNLSAAVFDDWWIQQTTA